MLNAKTLVHLTILILFGLGLNSVVHAQTETKCDPDDKNCLKAVEEKETNGTSEAAVAASKKLAPLKLSKDSTPLPNEAKKMDPPTSDRSTPTFDEASQTQTPEQDAQALAKKLANPVASLISLPLQNNFDFGMGPNEDGFRYTLNVQPVIPIALSKDWNVISRTIVPIIGQTDVVGPSSQFGLGDTVQSFFFSPNKSEPFVWGLGPQFLIPTATNEYLGTQKFGVGITGLILKQKGKWTVGSLVNHMWSVAGKDTRADVSLTYIQPFLSYTTKTAWTFNLNTESTYDWEGKTWNVPIHFTVSKLVKLGKRPVSIGGSLRCWANSGPGGPQWCGFRLIFTPLFPKK